MHEENLAAPRQFLPNRVLNDIAGKWRDHGLNGTAAFRRCLDGTKVAQADQGHMQRTRNGRGAQHEDVDLAAHLFDPLFMRDPKAVFLIHHEQSEGFKAHILLQQAVGANDNIHGALAQSGQGVL